MGKHTPGPWKVDTDRQVAGCNGDIAITSGQTTVAVAYARLGRPGETLANVHLIAAAPELYGLLKEQIECYDKMPMSDLNYAGIEWIKRARAAIAKAEGRNHDEP